RPPLDRRADVLLPHVGRHALAQVLRDFLRAVEGEEAGAVIRGERLPDLFFRYVEVFDERFLDAGVVDARAAHRGFDVFVGDDAFVYETAETGGFGLTGGAMLVVKRDPQNSPNLLGRIFVECGERDAVTFVDQLHDAEEIFLEEDGDGEDGFGAEAGLLVPSLIEAEVRVKLREFGRFVSVFDVDGFARERGESGDRRERFRNANFLRRVADFLQRVQLLILRV